MPLWSPSQLARLCGSANVLVHWYIVSYNKDDEFIRSKLKKSIIAFHSPIVNPNEQQSLVIHYLVCHAYSLI